MTGGVWQVAVAGLFLLAAHFGVSSTALRGALVVRLGQGPYLGLYSLVAVLAFWWLAAAYNAAPLVPVWDYAPWQSWVPLVVNLPAVYLVLAGMVAPNPTSVGQERRLEGDAPVRGIQRITRNPFLWGVGLWALAHMVPNGDAASLLLFGTLAVLALAGAVLIDAKLSQRLGPAWQSFAAATSNLPFAAIAVGRQRLVVRELGWLAPALAVVVYGTLLHVHPWLFGVVALPH